jgi:hypothetical protein
MNKIFSIASDVECIADVFRGLQAPKLPNPSKFAEWRNELDNLEGINHAIRFCHSHDQVSQVVYYSTRLGFKETKHSISTASQSLLFSSLPCWSMCTIFHEYMHSHVRALFSQFYPHNSLNNINDFDRSYDLYSTRSDPNNDCSNLYEFIQTCFLSVASDLSEGTDISIARSKDNIIKALHDWHHTLNEIIVHILDYTYFYEFNNDVYVKGIWSSWITLPFIYSKIPEYLLRTICAVASNERGTEEEVFEHSKGVVLRNLSELKKYHGSDILLLETVIQHLEESQEIDLQFYKLYPIIYIVKQFLISSKLESICVDADAAWVKNEDGEGYSLEFTPGVFEERRINSPATFLKEYLAYAFDTEMFMEPSFKVEFITLWLLSVISSSLPIPSD